MTSPEPGTAPNPSGRPPPSPWQRVYAFLVSPKLAIALLVVVLLACVVGVTAIRGADAWRLIFSTLWFNGLLVLLAVSSGAAFFTRIWKRKLTLVSAGLILFHLSFVALLGGVVANSLLHFKGAMRLTEGETLRNWDPDSYDTVEMGRFFDFARLRGETTLVAMHRGFKVGGQDKRAAYEIEVADGAAVERSIIYITEYHDFDGIRYFCSKEGYSVLVIMYGKDGQELYGAHVPLQSLLQADGKRLYTTGSAMEAGGLPFPQDPEPARLDLQIGFFPSSEDRMGQVAFTAKALGKHGATGPEKKGLVAVGETFDAGDVLLEPREIRYWAGMDVRYDPGLPVSLGSLVSGLVGMVLILIGRLRQGGGRKRTE